MIKNMTVAELKKITSAQQEEISELKKEVEELKEFKKTMLASIEKLHERIAELQGENIASKKKEIVGNKTKSVPKSSTSTPKKSKVAAGDLTWETWSSLENKKDMHHKFQEGIKSSVVREKLFDELNLDKAEILSNSKLKTTIDKNGKNKFEENLKVYKDTDEIKQNLAVGIWSNIIKGDEERLNKFQTIYEGIFGGSSKQVVAQKVEPTRKGVEPPTETPQEYQSGDFDI